MDATLAQLLDERDQYRQAVVQAKGHIEKQQVEIARLGALVKTRDDEKGALLVENERLAAQLATRIAANGALPAVEPVA